MKKAIISLIFLLSFCLAALAATTSADLRPDAPNRYTVVPGDTLWSIAIRFLKDPWRWPELWKMNQSQIRNPHRIYPGDVLVLDRSGGDVRLRLETSRVGPRARIEPLDVDAIQTISPSVIEPFLSKPLVFGTRDLDFMPRIVATQEDRVALGAGDIGYAEGLAGDQETRWRLYRRGDPLVDPETKQMLGYVGIYLGEAEMVKRGRISTVKITRAPREIVRGDMLFPLPKENPVFAYVPHAPAKPVTGRVISTYGGLGETGPLSIIVLSKGTRDGLEMGHVLALHRDQKSSRYTERTQPLFGRQGPTGKDDRVPYYPAPGGTVRDSPLIDREPPVRDSDFAQVPPERYGLVMIFRTFERASYGLVMQASKPVAVQDIFSNP